MRYWEWISLILEERNQEHEGLELSPSDRFAGVSFLPFVGIAVKMADILIVGHRNRNAATPVLA
jgi:hypothetical protein